MNVPCEPSHGVPVKSAAKVPLILFPETLPLAEARATVPVASCSTNVLPETDPEAVNKVKHGLPPSWTVPESELPVWTRSAMKEPPPCHGGVACQVPTQRPVSDTGGGEPPPPPQPEVRVATTHASTNHFFPQE